MIEFIAAKPAKRNITKEQASISTLKRHANAVGRSSWLFPIVLQDFVLNHVLEEVTMKDYRKRVESYLISRSYFDSLLKEGAITQSEFNKINKKLLAKYNVSKRSVFNSDWVALFTLKSEYMNEEIYGN